MSLYIFLGSVLLSMEVGPQCDNHVVRSGGCLRLTCSSSPHGPVSWSRLDGQQIRSTPYSCVGSTACSGGPGDEGTLLVENVTPEDAGIYICSASFLNDTVQEICRVTVGGNTGIVCVCVCGVCVCVCVCVGVGVGVWVCVCVCVCVCLHMCI